LLHKSRGIPRPISGRSFRALKRSRSKRFGLVAPNDMDSALKELDKLDKLTSSTPAASGKSRPTEATLDDLLDTLRDYKSRLQAGTLSDAELKALPKLIEGKKKDVDARQQEIYGVLSRYGKALDKVRCCSCAVVVSEFMASLALRELAARVPATILFARSE
jgi:hypothetical protein